MPPAQSSFQPYDRLPCVILFQRLQHLFNPVHSPATGTRLPSHRQVPTLMAFHAQQAAWPFIGIGKVSAWCPVMEL
jgi:hypothetical protein